MRWIALSLCVVAAGCGGHAGARPTRTSTLRLPYPVATLSADGSQVAVGAAPHSPQLAGLRTPPFVLWNAHTRAVTRFSAPRWCTQPMWTTLAGGRLVADCASICCDASADAVVAFAPGHAPVDLFRSAAALHGRLVGTTVTGLAGGGGTVAFSTETDRGDRETRVYVVDGHRVRVIRQNAGVVVAADGQFVVTVLRSHAVLVFRRDGTHARRTPYPGTSAFIDRRRVASFVYGEVWEPGQPRAALSDLPLAPGATLGGSTRGLLAYTTADAVHVVRLHDGHDARYGLGGGYPVAADITNAGLFYAVDAVPPWKDPDQSAGRYRSPSWIVFVPWRAVVSRLAVAR